MIGLSLTISYKEDIRDVDGMVITVYYNPSALRYP